MAASSSTANEDAKAGEPRQGQREEDEEFITIERGKWECSPFWHHAQVCGGGEWTRPADELESLVEQSDAGAACGRDLKPIRFIIRKPGSGGEVEVKVAYIKRKRRVAVVLTWGDDKEINVIRKYPKDSAGLSKWLLKVLPKILNINPGDKSVEEFKRELKEDLEPVKWAFNWLVKLAYFKTYCHRRGLAIKPIGLGSISELKEKALIRRTVRACVKTETIGNYHACVSYLLFVPRGGRVMVFYVDGEMNRVYEVTVKRVNAGALPSRLAIVYDPIQDEDYLVAFMGDRFIDAIPLRGVKNDELVRRLASGPGLFVMERLSDVIASKLIDYLTRTRYFKVPIVIGIWPDYGLIDLHGAIDANDNGPAPIADAVRWINEHYNINNRQAKAVVAYALAKFFTPAIKMIRKQFVDPIIINIGPGGVGLSTLSRELIVKGLMGIEPDDTRYLVVIAGSVKTEPQYRNLADINALPLILDEQKLTDIINNKAVIHSSAVGVNVMGIHAARYGRGIGAAFLSLRGVIINTNAKKDEILRVLGNEETLYTYIRRLRFIPWGGGVQALNEGASAAANPPSLRPVVGFLVRLMNKYWDELSKVGTFDELAHLLLDLIRREANGNEDVIKAVNELEEAIKAIEETEKAERAGLFTVENDATVFINNLKRITIAHKRTADLPNMLLTLLELDRSYGVVFSINTRDDEDEVRRGVEESLRLIGVIRDSVYNTNSNISSGATSLEDVANEPGAWGEVARRLLGMLSNKIVRVSIENGSSLIGGRKDSFLGKTPSYLRSLGGKEGFSLRLDELINNIVKANVTSEVDEGVGNEQTE
ncbi:MAG: hypothetical protein RXN91_04100 [Caldivirga sp.]